MKDPKDKPPVPPPVVNIPPTTTAEADIRTSAQRRINLIWETMQAAIAASVVGTALYVSGHIALLVLAPDVTESQYSIANTSFMLLSNLASLIIGFYFGRTNHQKTGGVERDHKGR